MKSEYLSIFSGIGGLEHPLVPPLLFCERDEACQHILRGAHPGVPIFGDVRALDGVPPAGLVVGGWPCQDLSSAGTLGGIRGQRSGLFFEMLRLAKAAGAHSLVGENVPNLLTINNGADFRLILDTLSEEGYAHIGWRVLNARQFGLPQQRRRLFIVASRYRERAEAIHASLPPLERQSTSSGVFAFYWTGGKRSICFSKGYTPALKVGATDDKGRAPVAVLVGERLRKLSSHECLRLQGFDDIYSQHPHLARSTLLRMAGNAVPRPMGRFVVKTVYDPAPCAGLRNAFGVITDSGLWENGLPWSISHVESPLAANLADFLDLECAENLSNQAAAGLLVRSVRAKRPMPLELFDLLAGLAAQRDSPLRPSRANSFEALGSLSAEIAEYSAHLVPIARYLPDTDEDS